ncbi:amino acid/amide ABC transporter membrane protein 1 (HAAT family) [Micromonospora pisi]|uniref:Amino acid/amide ABC transporter membrane protein 1 (HAAT family) n=1 Tax=Micromonospora pisi TaxID=589240 RepID=A0A495JHP3_9ACTN|nr:branched-chain amino acid ABC transporter permease [Micromonospora pisi]RKR88413.1 amino acid/amide ABC transporter membrane protein 1 (HAAT family) [Micromonospora pisi]
MGQTGMYVVTAIDGVAFGLLLFVVAAGLMLIFGVMGILNLAHGTLYLAGAYLAYLLTNGNLWGFGLALAAGVALGTAGGAALSAVLRPLTGRDHLDQALVTLGVAFLAADGFTTVFDAAPLPVTAPRPLDGSIDVAGHGYPVYRLTFIVVAAAIGAGLHLVIRRSTAGVLLRATVSDPPMAAATGINAGRVRTAAMAGGGVLAVTAGVLGAPLLGPAPGVDTTVLVLSLIVVVLGGAGSTGGTLAAALLVGQVQTVGVLLAPAAAPFALFSALLIVLVVRGRTGDVPAVRAA